MVASFSNFYRKTWVGFFLTFEYGCSFVGKLSWKKNFFLKKYLFFTKYTLFAEQNIFIWKKKLF